MKVLSQIQRSGQAITLMAILGLVSFSSLIQMNSNNVSKLRLFQEGIQTCFSRVAQTFTARTIGDLSSPYVASEFKGFTEECFGEALVAFENIRSFKASEILTETNKINKEVYELHQKITATTPLNTPENVMMANIGSRYEKLEIKRDNVLEMVDESLQKLSMTRSNLKMFFYFFAVVTPFLILMTLMRNIRKERMFRRVEQQASDLIQDENFQASRVENFINSTLKEFELHQVKALFDTYRTRRPEHSSDSIGKSSFVNPALDIEAQLTDVWKETKSTTTNKQKRSEEPTPTQEVSNIEESVSVVIDSLAEKLFMMGVTVDINVRKTLAVMSREDLDQIIYHAVTALLQNSDKNARHRSLGIFLRNDSTTTTLNMVYSGSKEIDLSENIELSICKQLLEDNEGTLTIDKRSGASEVSSVLTLEFKRAPQSKLVDIKKTTKKDWINKGTRLS